MLNLQCLQLTVSPGTDVVFWYSRMVERRYNPVSPVIEILPENHADLSLNFSQRKGLLSYDRQGQRLSPESTRGQRIDFYC